MGARAARRAGSPAAGSPAAAAAGREFDPGEDPLSAPCLRSLAKRYGSPLFVVDLQRVRRQYRRLAAALPGVALHYALKPLPHFAVVRALRDAGACFDLATSGEVDLVRREGVDPRRCIHTHPIKRDSDIRSALAFGVDRFVVDNPDELRKFVKHRSRVSLLVRVSFRSPDAVCDLSKKFGCAATEVPDLLALAAELRLRVQGLSFHVGSQCADPGMFVTAIGICRGLMDAAASAGMPLGVLDIGGGFPTGPEGRVPAVEDFCAPIRQALGDLPPGTHVIAEPGRFIAAPSAAVVASVMGRSRRDGRWWYYLDDGLYGSYSGRLYDHANYPIEALARPGLGQPCPLHASVLAGPTCDSIDVIEDQIELPELDVGDLIVGRSMGAYTWASASDFNFFPRATVLALDQGRLMTEREPR